MKRYVRECANDCLKELDRLEQFDMDAARYYGRLDAKEEKELRSIYAGKRQRVKELLEQCQYGYISDLKAVELIARV